MLSLVQLNMRLYLGLSLVAVKRHPFALLVGESSRSLLKDYYYYRPCFDTVGCTITYHKRSCQEPYTGRCLPRGRGSARVDQIN